MQGKKTYRVPTPFLPVAIDILSKYKNGFPAYTNQTALNYLKDIGEKAGITRLHSVIEDRGGEVVTTQVEIYEPAGAHAARRSLICNMLKHGYDSHTIMKITGHNDVKSFKKHAGLTSEDTALLMLEAESTRVRQSDKVPTTISQEGNKEAINILKQYQNTINGITLDTLLGTQLLASRINKTSDMSGRMGYVRNGKLYDYSSGISGIVEEIEAYMQSPASGLEIVHKYVERPSVGNLSNLRDELKLLIVKCIKVKVDVETVMQIADKAFKMGILDNGSFNDMREIVAVMLTVKDR